MTTRRGFMAAVAALVAIPAAWLRARLPAKEWEAEATPAKSLEDAARELAAFIEEERRQGRERAFVWRTDRQ